MIKYLYTIVFAALLASHWWVYNHGKNVIQEHYDKAALEYKAKEDKLIAELQAKLVKTEIVFRERIKIIKEVADATPCNCLNAPIDPAVLDELRKSDSR